MRIRAFEDADEDEVIALWRACGLLHPWNDPRKDIARKRSVQRDLFLLAVVEERIAASAMFGYDGHRGWVSYLGVSPDRRGEGLGGALMREGERRLLALGCPTRGSRCTCGTCPWTSANLRVKASARSADEPDVKQDPQDRRCAERVALSIVGISLDDAWCGQGRIADISANGARIEGAVPLGAIGSEVRLGFYLSVDVGVDVQRCEVQGTVVRHTQQGGFAIRFHDTGDALAKVIDLLVWYGAELAQRGSSELLDFEKDGLGSR